MAANSLNPTTASPVERRIRIAAVLIAAGLLLCLLTFIRIHPLSFITFALLSAPLVLIGALFFLYAIVSQEPGS
jgi:hypothetical protein